MIGTIKSAHIERPVIPFLCDVLRTASHMRYQDSADGKWKPLHPERWEKWQVLAETKEGAQRIAEYHFFQSDKKNIIISEL